VRSTRYSATTVDCRSIGTLASDLGTSEQGRDIELSESLDVWFTLSYQFLLNTYLYTGTVCTIYNI
jgi:hypothetical protein